MRAAYSREENCCALHPKVDDNAEPLAADADNAGDVTCEGLRHTEYGHRVNNNEKTGKATRFDAIRQQHLDELTVTWVLCCGRV